MDSREQRERSGAVRGQPAGQGLLCVFRVKETLYAVDTIAVQEIIRRVPITPVPWSREDILGILNLRGRIVTVVDLRRRLGEGPTEPDEHSRVLIVDWDGEPVGLLVELLEDVVQPEEGGLAPPPSNIDIRRRRFLDGLCHTAHGLAGVLNIGALLAPEESAGAAVGART